MNRDWQVRPLSRKSSVSGEAFEAGATVICYIFNQGQGDNEWVRKDVLVAEVDSLEPSNNLVAKWTRRVKEEAPQKESLGNAEDLFLSLYEDLVGEISELIVKQREILKQILGLMLERKRILRRIQTKDKENIIYLHVATNKEYRILKKDLDLEEILKLQPQLESVIC